MAKRNSNSNFNFNSNSNSEKLWFSWPNGTLKMSFKFDKNIEWKSFVTPKTCYFSSMYIFGWTKHFIIIQIHHLQHTRIQTTTSLAKATPSHAHAMKCPLLCIQSPYPLSTSIQLILPCIKVKHLYLHSSWIFLISPGVLVRLGSIELHSLHAICGKLSLPK